jgi:hypothetical protein
VGCSANKLSSVGLDVETLRVPCRVSIGVERVNLVLRFDASVVVHVALYAGFDAFCRLVGVVWFVWAFTGLASAGTAAATATATATMLSISRVSEQSEPEPLPLRGLELLAQTTLELRSGNLVLQWYL